MRGASAGGMSEPDPRLSFDRVVCANQVSQIRDRIVSRLLVDLSENLQRAYQHNVFHAAPLVGGQSIACPTTLDLFEDPSDRICDVRARMSPLVEFLDRLSEIVECKPLLQTVGELTGHFRSRRRRKKSFKVKAASKWVSRWSLSNSSECPS